MILKNRGEIVQRGIRWIRIGEGSADLAHTVKARFGDKCVLAAIFPRRGELSEGYEGHNNDLTYFMRYNDFKVFNAIGSLYTTESESTDNEVTTDPIGTRNIIHIPTKTLNERVLSVLKDILKSNTGLIVQDYGELNAVMLELKNDTLSEAIQGLEHIISNAVEAEESFITADTHSESMLKSVCHKRTQEILKDVLGIIKNTIHNHVKTDEEEI